MKKIEYDALFVGGGIASLSGAHRLVDMALEKNTALRIAVLEKGKDFGAHVLSGAVANPRSIKKLFPDYEKNGFPVEGVCRESHLTLMGRKKTWDVPSVFTPPEMKKEGYLILTLSLVAKWMAEKLLEKVKDNTTVTVDLYPGFPANEIVYENDRVAGVRVDDTGNPERDNCYAKVTVFGDKGFLSRDLVKKYNLAENIQTWAVGVKEIWEVKKDCSGKVWHTIGYPLLDGTFGGGFVYGLKNNRLAIGMVAGLDAKNPNLRPPQILQEFKKHPWVQGLLKGGKIVNYGASLIPEGGYYAMPREFAVGGAVIIGDALSVLDLRGFSGIDNAVESAITASDVIFDALQKNDCSADALQPFKRRLMDGWVGKELYESRYYRYSFNKHNKLFKENLPSFIEKMDGSNPYLAGLMTALGSPSALGEALAYNKLMNGKTDIGKVAWADDRTRNVAEFKTNGRSEPEGYDKNTIYSTADIVFYAHTHYHEDNSHIDEFDMETCKRCLEKYGQFGNDVPCIGDCTAEVHEVNEKDGVRFHAMNMENCVQCRTCEIVCWGDNLRVNPALHGSGPDFSGL
ncbi:MAG: electron transfer flavoprotein [bacterium]|nr:MAG: electron transfer flavoprotein [bacterium]